MRLSYLVQRINLWFARMAWGRSGIDEMLDGMLASETHWSILLLSGVSKLVIGLARLVLKGMAILSHGLTMNLSRQAEFDADAQSARIVGSEAAGNALQGLPYVDAAFNIALDRAQAGWQKRQLPDDLVIATHLMHGHLPESIKNKLTAAILTSEASWFDTHPPLYKRIATLKKARRTGVLKLDAPATVLFKGFDELCKFATLDLYQSVLGNALQPEHLVATNVAVSAKIA